jgi:hypothetical protein
LIETADATPFAGQHGSLALDAAGNPHIGYARAFTSDVMHARKIGGAWAIDAVDTSAFIAPQFISIALDAAGSPQLAFHNNLSSGFDLHYARKFEWGWAGEVVDASGVVGQMNSIAIDAQGNPHLSYADYTSDNLKYATKVAGLWTIETADGSPADAGYHTSIALDPTGRPCVSYYDNTNDDLMYARRSAGEWTVQVADGSASNVGLYTSIAIDMTGSPRVSYHDVTSGNLLFAYLNDPTGVDTIDLGGAARGAGAGALALAALPSVTRGGTEIRASLPFGGGAAVSVYDAAGRLVRRLAAAPGETAVYWDGRDERGAASASGVFFARAEGHSASRPARIVLQR